MLGNRRLSRVLHPFFFYPATSHYSPSPSLTCVSQMKKDNEYESKTLDGTFKSMLFFKIFSKFSNKIPIK